MIAADYAGTCPCCRAEHNLHVKLASARPDAHPIPFEERCVNCSRPGVPMKVVGITVLSALRYAEATR